MRISGVLSALAMATILFNSAALAQNDDSIKELLSGTPAKTLKVAGQAGTVTAYGRVTYNISGNITSTLPTTAVIMCTMTLEGFANGFDNFGSTYYSLLRDSVNVQTTPSGGKYTCSPSIPYNWKNAMPGSVISASYSVFIIDKALPQALATFHIRSKTNSQTGLYPISTSGKTITVSASAHL